jgi:DNA-binding NtrC family response regulator
MISCQPGGWWETNKELFMVEHTSGSEKSNVQGAAAGEPAAVCPKNDVYIYVVDDEQMFGELVAAALEMAGFQIKRFINPAAALEAFVAANPRPALLMTDFLMPDLNGMELIESCKRTQPTLKTILYSGYVRAEVIQRYQLKPDFFIWKPFDPRILADVARSVLAR